MSNPLSDFNTSRFTPSVSSRKYIYSDLDFSLRLRPGYRVSAEDAALGFTNPGSDVYTLTDIDAIKNSIRNLCMTNLFERPFQPEVGTRISQMLFENLNPLAEHAIKEEIENVIREFEPRVSEIEVQTSSSIDSNSLSVSIYFTISNDSVVQNLELNVNRIR